MGPGHDAVEEVAIELQSPDVTHRPARDGGAHGKPLVCATISLSEINGQRYTFVPRVGLEISLKRTDSGGGAVRRGAETGLYQARMTDEECFLQAIKQGSFNARAKLRVALVAVRAAVRLRRLPHTAARAVSLRAALADPYTMRVLRKVIDGCAFRVYGHWVKKGEGQNRAALFENTPKTELKSLYVTNLSR
ncbi:hypothetical protein MSG28_005931 [Choristoneura fumiferana]|uniref:Uncharacterized protein n=1 Tax=Choristoneura fumiferana TaxID=7141 RepID=A0ACC0L0W9_CHOFU|nr:hypothetical protein MSG28_005931 [Choristoneura fumiferana]